MFENTNGQIKSLDRTGWLLQYSKIENNWFQVDLKRREQGFDQQHRDTMSR